MRALRIGKVVVNIGVGASGDPLDHSMTIMEQLTGQKPCQRYAKQTIRSFNIRKKEPIACMVTLRGEKAKTFLKKAFKAIDNRVNPKSFDKWGNFAFGIREHIDIPGTRYDPALGITGMDVIVTVERPGYQIDKKKHARGKVGKQHRVTSEESMAYIKNEYGIEVGLNE
nr:50S ribosomal protein L5, large subunit ribosomal protein L5 [uncultured archaeon]